MDLKHISWQRIKKLFFFEKSEIALEDLEFMSDVAAASQRRGNVWMYRLCFALLGLFVLALTLSCIVEREEVTRGEGHIIFSRGVQPIQSPDAGIVLAVLVKENEIVSANATLARISNTQAMAEYQDLLNKEADYSLAIKRLLAEREGIPLVYTEEERNEHSFAVRDQFRLFNARLERFEGERRELEALLEQKKREVEGGQLTRIHTEKSLMLLKQQEEQILPLVKSRSYPEMEYLKLKQRIIAQEAELNGLAQSISRAQSAVRESEGKLANLGPERQTQIADEQNDLGKRLKAVGEAITGRKDKAYRSELKAPMRGVIKRILLKEDNVVRQAEAVMELLPLDDSLEVEARFRPEDRGFLEVGQNATVKISAYDFSIYGGLAAHVESISADTIEDAKGRPWYEVRLKASTSTLPGKDDLEVKVGMTVSADVFSGKKSIFSYLMKPLLKTRQSSNAVRQDMTDPMHPTTMTKVFWEQMETLSAMVEQAVPKILKTEQNTNNNDDAEATEALPKHSTMNEL